MKKVSSYKPTIKVDIEPEVKDELDRWLTGSRSAFVEQVLRQVANRLREQRGAEPLPPYSRERSPFTQPDLPD